MSNEQFSLQEFSQEVLLDDSAFVNYCPPAYSSSFEDSHEDFIVRLRDDVEQLADLLIDHFPVSQREGGVYLLFDRADKRNFERLIEANPRLGVKALLASCQLTHATLTDDFQIHGLGKTFTDDMDVDSGGANYQEFISVCMSELCSKRNIESILLPYFRHRERYERSKEFYIYSELHDRLSTDQFSLSRGTGMDGSPNVIISEPGIDHENELPDEFIAVTAIGTSRHELMKRIKSVTSRLKSTRSEHPQCKTVLYLRLKSFPANKDDRAYKIKKREEIQDITSGHVDRVFFMSEFDEFVDYCSSSC